jgi:polysaccharide deacetylase family protein (PEP-CTERM system associated)
MDKEKYILLTIDVEDWFQVENFRPWIPFETWDQRELRVERNVHRLLDLFDSIELKAENEKEDYELSATSYELAPKVHNELSAMSYELKSDGRRTTDNGHTKKVRATFFVLGWIAERLPHLIREIHARGHEIASHGYNHNLCNRQPHADLKRELAASKKLLEDITGAPVSGFRAPNFSIDDEVLNIVQDCGYQYDSSYNSFGLHGRYGKISLNGHGRTGIAHRISENFFELPISNIHFRNPLSLRERFVLPWGGGGYFRLFPSAIFIMGIKAILKRDDAYLFYAHPWELDPGQPRVANASLKYKFRHYIQLGETRARLQSLIERFAVCEFTTCKNYLGLVSTINQSSQDEMICRMF